MVPRVRNSALETIVSQSQRLYLLLGRKDISGKCASQLVEAQHQGLQRGEAAQVRKTSTEIEVGCKNTSRNHEGLVRVVKHHSHLERSKVHTHNYQVLTQSDLVNLTQRVTRDASP